MSKNIKIYAMSDLHLGLGLKETKSMDRFGQMWHEHHKQIAETWERWVSDDDIVLIPGDISWATKLEDAIPDLEFIKSLPGYKVILKGNHDFWFQSISRVRKVFNGGKCFVLQNDAIVVGNVGIAGTRGWTCPGSSYWKEGDQKIYDREAERLKRSLDSLPDDVEYRIVMMHYPPTNEHLHLSGFTELLEAYDINKCAFGHLHKNESRLTGNVNGVDYYLCSCDHLGFRPLLLKILGEQTL